MNDKFNMVGTSINEFELPNSLNETVNIKEFQGKSNVVIILLRDIR